MLRSCFSERVLSEGWSVGLTLIPPICLISCQVKKNPFLSAERLHSSVHTCLQGAAGASHGVLDAVQATPAFERLMRNQTLLFWKSVYSEPRTYSIALGQEVDSACLVKESQLRQHGHGWAPGSFLNYFFSLSHPPPTPFSVPTTSTTMQPLPRLQQQKAGALLMTLVPSTRLPCVIAVEFSKERIRCRIIIIIFIIVLSHLFMYFMLC